MEFDFARFRETSDAGSFVGILNRICDESLTRDFWDITLPIDMATSSPRSPSIYAFYASLNLLEARALFIHSRFEDYQNARTMVVECWPSASPVYVSGRKNKSFYLRTGGSTSELDIEKAQGYIKTRF